MKNTHTDQVIRIVEGRARSEQPTGRLCAELEGEAAKQEKTNKPMTKNSSRRAVGAALFYCFHRASAYSLKNKRQQCGVPSGLCNRGRKPRWNDRLSFKPPCLETNPGSQGQTIKPLQRIFMM